MTLDWNHWNRTRRSWNKDLIPFQEVLRVEVEMQLKCWSPAMEERGRKEKERERES